MPPMRFPRPRSLSGLMLIGFTIVAAPLLFAIVNAAVQMNRLSNHSEQLVVRGMQGSGNNQRMFVEIAALERTARLYQVLPNNDLLEAYARNQHRLESTLDELLMLALDKKTETDARALKTQAQQRWDELRTAPPNSARMADLESAYSQMSDLATQISTHVGS